MANNTTTQLDQAEQAIIEGLERKLTSPSFNWDPGYVLATRHAIELVRLEARLAREAL